MANAYLPALDDYGDAALPLDRLLHRHRRMIQVRPCEGEWPEFHGRHVCQDRTEHWRDHHTYVVETRRGIECFHCGRLRPGRNGGPRIIG